MMSVLVYIGIRILLSSTSSQKAKYKQLLGDWFIGMVLLFTMHYIMIFSNIAVEHLTELFKSINPMGQTALIPDDNGNVESELKEYDIEVVTQQTEVSTDNKKVYKYDDGKNKYIEWNTDLMGQLRIALQAHRNDSESYIGYTVMYITMVIYTATFCFIYVRRVIYLAFLTIIAPLVALTYPIDKANDGKAQGFDYWFKEYIFNLLLQPLHLLVYTILVSSAIKFAAENIIYSLIALGFVVSAEKILRQMFNFSKASTPGVFSGPAGAALTMAGMRWLFGHGPRGGKGDGSSKGLGKGGQGGEESSSENSNFNVSKAMSGLLGNGNDENAGRTKKTNNRAGNSRNDSHAERATFWNNNILDEIPDGLNSEQEAEFLRSRGYDDESIAKMRGYNSWENPTFWGGNVFDEMPDGLNSEQEAEFLRSRGYDDEAIGNLADSRPWDGPTYWNDDLLDEMPDDLNANEAAEFLRNQGYDDAAIAEKMGDSYIEPSPINISEEDNEPNGAITSNMTDENNTTTTPTKGLKRAISDTAVAFGDGMKQKFVRSLQDAQPVRTLGKLGVGALGAATFGTLGVAAGVAAGDAKSVAQYGAAGVAGGYKVAGGAYNAANKAVEVDGLGEVFERGYLGENEYKNKLQERKQIEKARQEETLKIIQDSKKCSRKEAKDEAERLAKKYMTRERKINDPRDWLAIEEMQNEYIVDKNGKKGSRKYTEDEAISAAVMHKQIGFAGKKEDDIKKLVKTNYPGFDSEKAFQIIRNYNKIRNK